MRPTRFARLSVVLSLVALCASHTDAQFTLTGTSYLQDFNSIGSGLPTGWSVYEDASLSTLGTSATFTSSATPWNSTSGVFRNISSDDILPNASDAAQAANSNRAVGFRPLSTAASRDGAVTFTLSDTQGFEGFNLSVSLFTANNVSLDQSYALEYRVGSSGNFTSLGTYLTGAEFSATTLTADSTALSAIDNQSELVYFRVRGTTPSGTGNFDTLGIDDFSLTYSASAIPEPSTYAALAGAAALGLAIWKRRRQRGDPASPPRS